MENLELFESLGALLSIVLIDLVLSGDNAVVIGMAARNLSGENRRRAIVFGGAAAVGLRVLFTALAVFLLEVPLLHAIGGVLLFYIAWKLLLPGHQEDHEIKEAGSLREAIKTIVLADVVMSLDNILAVSGASHGDFRLLLFGLALSIPLLLLGAEFIARLLGRLPQLLYVGCIILIHTAVTMILEDPKFHEWFTGLPEDTGLLSVILSVLASIVIIGGATYWGRRTQATPPAATA